MFARKGAKEWVLVLLLGLQLVALAVAVFVPIGFDRPSRRGFDSGDLLLVGVFYLATLLSGLVLTVQLRRWWLLALELLLPSALALLALTGALGI